MANSALQDTLDRLAVTSAQRWMLATVAVGAASSASVMAAVVAGGSSPALPVIVTAAAIAAVVWPDSHVAAMTVALVALHWTFAVDDITTAVAVPAALALYLFHTVVALLAVTPPTVTVDVSVLARWGRRSIAVAAATCWTWLTVAMLANRDTPGNVALTATSLVTLAALIVAARAHTHT